jgi:hypothetical protein
MSLFAFFFITLHLISRNVIRLYELIKISKKKNMRSRTSTWFETKVKYQKTMEDGSEKVVSEAYVVDALSFTEAESAIIDEMSVYVSGELKVSGIGKAGYGEIFFSDVDDDDKWYKAKLQFITIDEIKARYFADDDAFCERSWGMSHDYHIAVKHGSTMVRVGTTIFGPRIY